MVNLQTRIQTNPCCLCGWPVLVLGFCLRRRVGFASATASCDGVGLFYSSNGDIPGTNYILIHSWHAIIRDIYTYYKIKNSTSEIEDFVERSSSLTGACGTSIALTITRAVIDSIMDAYPLSREELNLLHIFLTYCHPHGEMP